MIKILLTVLLLLQCTLTQAAAIQDHAQIKTAITTFLHQQIPGKASFNIDDIDKRLALKACNKIETFIPDGSQLIGRTSIGVRCTDTPGWSIFVPVQIRISRDLLVSARPLLLGQIVHEEDIARQTTEITQNTGLTDPRLIIGKVLRYSVAAGYIMREDMLRAPYNVKQGQSVKLSVQGNGFSLSSSGVALNNASEGETVQVRTNAGRVISGIAVDEGVVRINP